MEESLEGLDTLSLSFVEGLYADYLRDAESVSPDWRSYFEETSNGNGAASGVVRQQFRLGPSFHPPSLFSAPRLMAGDANGQAVAQANAPALRSGSPERSEADLGAEGP